MYIDLYAHSYILIAIKYAKRFAMERTLTSFKLDNDVLEALRKYADQYEHGNKTRAVNDILRKKLKVKR